MQTMNRYKVTVNYLVGTMIEIQRAVLTANEIATEAQFFSFGTNDLTQMTMGFSRDDAGKFLRFYLDKGILPSDPFISLDIDGVGQLVRMGVEKGRSVRESLKVGICGEHGGDPRSIEFCHSIGMNYVSCSPFRVPIARLVAAQAALRQKGTLAKATGIKRKPPEPKEPSKLRVRVPVKGRVRRKVLSIKQADKKPSLKKAAAKEPGPRQKR
jgi:pyruvate,orthophosphate dikinase